MGQCALNTRLLALKKEYEWLAETHSQVLQSVNLHLSRAFVNFFERRAQYPRFKSKQGKRCIQYPQGVKILGIDVGLNPLAVTSDGSKFENPRHITQATQNLKRKQQKLPRKMKGSHKPKKARLLVAKAHHHTANARQDYLHTVSQKLVDENHVIATEDLYVTGMMKNPCLAHSIGDAGWGLFTQFLQYKAERAGKGFIQVSRFFPSSKACSCCLPVQASLPLTGRSWRCDRRGARHDRDINAAQNIPNEAQHMVAAGTVGTCPSRHRQSRTRA